MSLQTQIQEEANAALKARDEVRLRTLRGLRAAFTNELVATKRKPTEELSDEEALAVIAREAKKHRESIEQFKKGNRPDLVTREEEELVVLEAYLPEMMGAEEIRIYVEKKKEELGVSDTAQKGTLMGAVMKELKGKADGGDVKRAVDEALGA